MSYLQLSGIEKQFGETRVIKGVDLQINKGEFVVFVGPSGCGKSTLLNIIGLLDNPDSGQYYFIENEVAKFSERQRSQLRKGNIGFVFQSFNLIDELTVYENVELPLLYLKIPADERKIKVEKALERMNMMHRRNHFPQQLSGGQQQRVAIVRALAMNPEVLLLDEITSALDPELVGEVLDVVRELKGSGITMLIATHEMNFAQEISDRVCFLDGGRVAEQGHPKQLFSSPSDERTRQFLRRVNF